MVTTTRHKSISTLYSSSKQHAWQVLGATFNEPAVARHLHQYESSFILVPLFCGSMFDDICSSVVHYLPDSPFSLISTLTLSNHLLLGLPLFRLLCKKGSFYIAHVSSPLDRSKRFTLFVSPGRPVHSNTNSAPPGSILARQQLRAKAKSLKFPTLSIARYSFTQLSQQGRQWRERKCPIFETITKRDSNPGSLDCESGILPLTYRAPVLTFPSSFFLRSALGSVLLFSSYARISSASYLGITLRFLSLSVPRSLIIIRSFLILSSFVTSNIHRSKLFYRAFCNVPAHILPLSCTVSPRIFTFIFCHTTLHSFSSSSSNRSAYWWGLLHPVLHLSLTSIPDNDLYVFTLFRPGVSSCKWICPRQI